MPPKKDKKLLRIDTLFGEDFDDDTLQIAKDAFNHFKPLYPSFSQFLNHIKDKEGADFLFQHRPFLTRWYFAQEVVQVFQPPPVQYMLTRKEGYFPKLIAFYPFERLYADTGKIIIYPMTRKEARKKSTVSATPPAPTTVPAPTTAPAPDTGDFDKRIKLYKNRREVADTAFIELFDSKRNKFRFEKRLGGDIPKAKQWINDNILQPYLQLSSDEEKDAFLKNKKGKK